MKFVCDRCQTRYTIADEKIQQRIVRIRCKNCGDVITLHAGEVVPGPQDASARFSSSHPTVLAEGRGSSKASRPAVPRTEWFVAVDGIEKGPLSCTEAAKYIVTLGPDASVHVWKEGMDEWKQPRDVAIIAQELSSLKRSPGRAPALESTSGSADATVITPPPVAFNTSLKPAPPKPGSASRLPGLGAKTSPTGSVPKLVPPLASAKAGPVASGSGPKHAPTAGPGSGPKAGPGQGSGPKAPPPIPASHRAPPPVPGVRTTPVAAASVVPDARPARISSTLPVVKTPSPVTAPQSTPVAAASAVPAAGPARASSTPPVAKTPAPATLRQPEAESNPGQEAATTAGAVEPAPVATSEFDDEVPTSSDSRRQTAHAVKDALSPESTPGVENTPGAQDFFQSGKTPAPNQPLPPVAAGGATRESKNWPVANLSFAHPPMMAEGMSADGAMALPTPAPLAGPLFANVADMPVKSLVGHAEVGLSKLTGLAALVHRHRHLKYVVAAGVLVFLVITVILLSWQGESGKALGKVGEIERKARAAALAAEPTPVAPEEPALAQAPAPEREAPSKPHPAAHASKRGSRAASASGKSAPAAEPVAAPAGMNRSDEKPIPLAAIQGRRAPAASEPRPISQSQISDVIRRKENQAALKTCYERALKRDGRLRTGRLDITVSIGAMGTVQRVQVNGSADFMVIDQCLKEAIRHWRFPANSEEYATSFPLILQGG